MAMNDELYPETESYIERRNELLKNIDRETIRKAWFTLSHLLLDERSKIVDMGCGTGTMTYAMAAMSPKLRFIGLDRDKRNINKAKQQYELHNLEFMLGDAADPSLQPESIDAVINSDVLHEIYSASHYNERIISDVLARQFKILKKGGVMFVRDYAQPPAGEYVLLEMPDTASKNNSLRGMSDADLLVWYSEHARPRQDAGTGGFFLEELPPRIPKTRLFRVPHKWAYEFIMRKDDREHWETQLPVEYTFFTMSDFHREMRVLGARLQYAAPHWEDEIITKKFEGRFALFDDYGAPMDNPPTCYVAVAYKMPERKSLYIEERRPSNIGISEIRITTLRDQKTGKLSDIVSRNINLSEIIPYDVDEEGQLKIYLHDGIARSIVNAVPRKGVNLDQRFWSSHMIEPVAVERARLNGNEQNDVKSAVLFARDYLSLKPKDGELLLKGPEYYPAPEYIDEHVSTFYLRIHRSKEAVMPRGIIGQKDRFQAKGLLREFDAQQVLNAITVGMIPHSRLELQILSLFQHLELKAETWTDKRMKFEAGEISGSKSLRKALANLGIEDKRFREVKGASGELRAIHSTFVEEGQVRGSVAGLSAQDVDFAIYDGRTCNTAVVLPLSSDISGQIHAGFHLDQTPVPERREGNGLTASAISFELPPDITDMKQARKFVAEKFSVMPEMVLKMGESYYNYIGITPQKIYPFAVAVPSKFMKDPGRTFMPLYQVMLMWQSASRWQNLDSRGKRAQMVWDTNLMAILGRSYRMLHETLQLDAKLQLQANIKQRPADQGPQWTIPMSYRLAPIIDRPKGKPVIQAPSVMPAAQKPQTPSPENIPETKSTPAKDVAGPMPSLVSDFEQQLSEFETLFEKIDNTDKPALHNG
ncbi:MAG: class I SAM-dependent methyltransferase [Alphaproteobacteria bacterium]